MGDKFSQGEKKKKLASDMMKKKQTVNDMY